MRKTDRRLYVAAMSDEVRRLARNRTNPVIVNVYRLFANACKRADISHTFRPGDWSRIVACFFDDLTSELLSGDGDEYPVVILRMTAKVERLVEHGKEAVIDSINTPAKYSAAAVVSRGNPRSAFALYGPLADKQHPIARTLLTEKQRILTSTENYSKKAGPFSKVLGVGQRSTIVVLDPAGVVRTAVESAS